MLDFNGGGRGRGIACSCLFCFCFVIIWRTHVTHSFGPAGEVPVSHARPHVALLAPLWPNSGTALLVVDDAALVSDASDIPRPPAQPTVH